LETCRNGGPSIIDHRTLQKSGVLPLATNEAWAAKLRARLIGDFRRWKDHDAYQQSFERVVRDLTIPPKTRADDQ
jgi:hypothetical protein